jgi:Zn-dependent protease
MNQEVILLGLIWYAVFLFSLVLHEFAHAFAGYKLGDDTAYREGQVSLNPVPHIKREIFGTIAVPILSYILGGWMIGWASAPFDYNWAAKNMKKSAAMSLAGPAANFILFILAALTIRIGYAYGLFQAPESINFSRITMGTEGNLLGSLAPILSIFFSLNLILMLFNLLPFPLFDGSSILLFFVKGEQAKKVFEFIHNPGFKILSILVAWRIFHHIYHPIHLFVINHLYPGVSYL